MGSPALEISLIIILIILNGIFSAGETAIISLRKSKIKALAKERKDGKAEKLLHMKENPERFLSAVQIGITLFGTLASAIGGTLAIQYLCAFVRRGSSFFKPFSDTIALGIVVVVLTYLFLVFGELVPKYVGLSNKEKVSIFIVPLFDFVSRFFFFLVNILSFSTMFFVKGLNLKHGEEHVGEGEIKILLEEGRRIDRQRRADHQRTVQPERRRAVGRGELPAGEVALDDLEARGDPLDRPQQLARDRRCRAAAPSA